MRESWPLWLVGTVLIVGACLLIAVVSSCDFRTFRPQDDITVAELAKVLVHLHGRGPTVCFGEGQFETLGDLRRHFSKE